MATVKQDNGSATDWVPVGSCPPLSTGLTVYRIAVAGFYEREAALLEVLIPEERARAARYVRPADRARFIIGRASLRYLLGERLGLASTVVPLQRNAFGKPQLPEPTSLYFSISHSGSWIIIAVGARSVGADVEKIDPGFKYAEVAAFHFSDAAQRTIQASVEPLITFYSLWTRREAVAKASGRGLSYFEEGGQQSVGEEQDKWAVRSFEVAAGYLGALAHPADWQPLIVFCAFDPSLIEQPTS